MQFGLNSMATIGCTSFVDLVSFHIMHVFLPFGATICSSPTNRSGLQLEVHGIRELPHCPPGEAGPNPVEKAPG